MAAGVIAGLMAGSAWAQFYVQPGAAGANEGTAADPWTSIAAVVENGFYTGNLVLQVGNYGGEVLDLSVFDADNEPGNPVATPRGASEVVVAMEYGVINLGGIVGSGPAFPLYPSPDPPFDPIPGGGNSVRIERGAYVNVNGNFTGASGLVLQLAHESSLEITGHFDGNFSTLVQLESARLYVGGNLARNNATLSQTTQVVGAENVRAPWIIMNGASDATISGFGNGLLGVSTTQRIENLVIAKSPGAVVTVAGHIGMRSLILVDGVVDNTSGNWRFYVTQEAGYAGDTEVRGIRPAASFPAPDEAPPPGLAEAGYPPFPPSTNPADYTSFIAGELTRTVRPQSSTTASYYFPIVESISNNGKGFFVYQPEANAAPASTIHTVRATTTEVVTDKPGITQPGGSIERIWSLGLNPGQLPTAWSADRLRFYFEQDDKPAGFETANYTRAAYYTTDGPAWLSPGTLESQTSSPLSAGLLSKVVPNGDCGYTATSGAIDYWEFTVLIAADQPEPTPGLTSCETAFAFDDELGTCFTEISGLNGNRWGWSIGPLEEGEYEFDLYAAAGQCVLENGSLVGTLTVNYADGAAEVTYSVTSGHLLLETHLYVGSTILPLDGRGRFTVAPGQFPLGGAHGQGVTSYSYTVSGLDGPVYVVAHSVVCPE